MQSQPFSAHQINLINYRLISVVCISILMPKLGLLGYALYYTESTGTAFAEYYYEALCIAKYVHYCPLGPCQTDGLMPVYQFEHASP